MASAHLAPGGNSLHAHSDPFATPSRTSLPGAGVQHGGSIEMLDGATTPPMTASSKPSFLQRWRQADERAYLATVGRIASTRKARNGEKAAAFGGAALEGRRRAPAWRCSLILGALLLVIIVAIVVPIAVVFSGHNSSTGGSQQPSSPGGGPAPTPNSNIVHLKQGSFEGTSLSNGVTQFLGMQYAAPPTGDLRFAAPQPPTNFSGVQAATKYAPGCHGLGKFDSSEDEDCLYLDVFMPSNTTSESKLPVYLFIQGGGLQNSATHYNLSSFIIASGMQVVTVTMTYRVNAFGFLASSEIEQGASLNNGLKDQRMALQWVQDNIAQFGGDPGRVVLAGESGGAGSAVMHMMAYGGRDDGLFHAAALQSQSLQAVRDVKASQFQYDYIVGNTSCKDSHDTLSCLRGVSIQGLVNAISNSPFPDGAGGNPVFPYNPVIDGDFLTQHPIVAYQAGKFVALPTIFGDDTNEGSIFVPKNSISSREDADGFLRDTFPLINSTMLQQYDKMYSLSSDTDNPDYWQKTASAYGETRYICPGMQLSDLVGKANGGKVWNFRYDVTDPAAVAAGLGVKHGSEMVAIFGPSAKAPNIYLAGGNSSSVVPLMQGYWTSFVKHFDPNPDRAAGTPNWDQWTGSNRLHVVVNGTAMEQVDDAQAARCQYLAGIADDIGQ